MVIAFYHPTYRERVHTDKYEYNPGIILKLPTFVRALLATCVITSATVATAAPTLLVTDGILMGANNVNVGGTLYNVTFEDDTCNAIFNHCAQSAFAFSTSVSAIAAGQALLDQVFVDGAMGQFNTLTYNVFGCSRIPCFTSIPYFARRDHADTADVLNYYGDRDSIVLSDVVSTWDLSKSGLSNFANFTTVNAVPEPSSLALLGLALAGMAALRRRKP